MRKMLTVGVLVVVLLALAGCQQTKKLYLSWGHPQTIYVFASDEMWERVEINLDRMLARDIYTTQNEKWFTIKRADVERFEDFYRFDNLLFLGALDKHDETTLFMLDLLGEGVKKQVRETGEGIYSKTEQWAKGQVAVFMLSDTADNLAEFNIRQSEKLFGAFKAQLYERTRKHIYLYQQYESETFFADKPWTLELPDNYVVYKQNPDDNFVCYFLQIGDEPERYIAVYSQQIAEPEDLREWMYEARNHVGAQYFAGEKILPTHMPRYKRVEFAGRKVWRMNGHWINDETVTGGAFQSWGFYDADTETAWLVDTSVFYPQGKKLPPMIELDIIAHTFDLK